MSKIRTALFAAGLVLAAAGAQAHGDIKPEHGGKIVETASGDRVELVAKGETLEVYLTDHADKPIPTAAMTGKAVILNAGKKTDLPLVPAGENKLSAVSPLGLDGATAVISVEGAGKKVSARFGG